MTAPAAGRDDAVAWFDRAVAGGDRWMFWSLRSDTLDELAAVARRLGGEVARVPGRVQPDGTQRVITTAPGPGRALDTCWRRGLPNWFYREDPATNPDRGVTEHGERGVAVTRLEIGADHLVPGSDFPALMEAESYRRTFEYIKESRLSDEEVDKILHSNVSALFDLD